MKTITNSAIALLLFIITGLGSCNKDTTCKAKINCKDSSGNAVSNAKVKLFATVENENHSKFKADMQAEGITDSNGDVTFAFKLPAIYDVSVAVSTKTASSIVKLEEGKTVSKDIVIQ